MRVIVTRPRDDAERTAAALRARGHEPLLSPVMAIRPTGAPVPQGPFDATVVTSANGLTLAGPLPAALLRQPLYAVGDHTARAAAAAGFTRIVAGDADGEALAERIAVDWPAGTRLLYLAGRERTPALDQGLARLGLTLDVAEVYAADPLPDLAPEARRALAAGESLAVVHFSPRSARLFLAQLDAGALRPAAARVLHACLSERVAEPLRAAGLPALVAERPREDALLSLVPVR